MASDDDEKKQLAILRGLLAAVAAGRLPDEAEANRLFKEWYPPVLVHARCRYPDEEGKELAQAVIARAWVQIKTGEGDWDSVRSIHAYLKTMLDHVVIDLHRSRRPRLAHQKDQQSDPGAGIQRRPAAEVALYSQDINNALARGMRELLTEREQEVWQLHWVEQLPLEDVADILGISKGTASKHSGNALRAMRPYLKSRGMDPADGGVA